MSPLYSLILSMILIYKGYEQYIESINNSLNINDHSHINLATLYLFLRNASHCLMRC
jgi:hypothetical protein